MASTLPASVEHAGPELIAATFPSPMHSQQHQHLKQISKCQQFVKIRVCKGAINAYKDRSTRHQHSMNNQVRLNTNIKTVLPCLYPYEIAQTCHTQGDSLHFHTKKKKSCSNSGLYLHPYASNNRQWGLLGFFGRSYISQMFPGVFEKLKKSCEGVELTMSSEHILRQ